MLTYHQHLELYPILAPSEKLILGTIHPPHIEDFQIPFFYGNKASLWHIFSDAFPELLPKPLCLENVLSFLAIKKIAVSDTIRICSRKKDSALDRDLEPIALNMALIEQIKNSKIKAIYCTSVYAFKLFYQGILGKKITKEILKNRQVDLEEKRFGRKICLYIIYSPSGAANIALASSHLYQSQKEKYKHSKRPIYDFKVDYYKNIFQ